MKNSPKVIASLLLALCALGAVVALASAAPPRQSDGPVVIINKPPSNSGYGLGDIISIESVSASPNGIVQVDLLVDGVVVHTDTTPGDLPQQQYTLLQRWVADLTGTHTITVKATDSENQTAQSSIRLNIASNTATPVPAPTLAPTPPPAVTPTPNTCVLSSKFIRDVTIPDNTVVAPGATFVKTWTMQNNGTCAWDPATVAIFVSGTRMAGASPSPVGAIQPGATFNLTINFVAPTSYGTFRSTWQFQSGSGTVFGQPFYVQIAIPAPATPIPPTPFPTAVPVNGCSGTPQISSFSADSTNITAGQGTTLRWGFVGNADSVFLQTNQGNGGVPSPGTANVNPQRTSTFTLSAYCKGVEATAQVTVNVNGGGGGGNTGAQGSIDGVNVGQRSGETQVRVFYTWNGAGGPAEVCASAPRSDSNPCTNARSNAPYANLNLAGSNVGKVTACLLDRKGHQVACGTN